MVQLIFLAVQIMVHEPSHILPFKAVTPGIFFHGKGIGFEIGGRIDHELEDQRRTTPVARHLSNDSREIAARAISTQREAGRITVQLSGVPGYPAGGGVAIFRRCRKFVFGSEAIVYRDDDATSLVREAAADVIVGVEVTDYPATAVKEDQYRERTIPRGSIDSDRGIACRTRNHAVFDAGNGFRFAKYSTLHAGPLAYEFRCKRMQRGNVEGCYLIQVGLSLGVEWHVLFSSLYSCREECESVLSKMVIKSKCLSQMEPFHCRKADCIYQ